ISALTGLPLLRYCAATLAVRICRISSQHRANYRHQLQYVSLSEEPFATSVPPNAPDLLLPPSLDPPLSNSVPWSSLDPSTTLLIDSRSPSEYAADHIQGAVNIPILSDSERAEVGIIFSRGNTLEARLKGARFACNNIAESLTPEGPLARLLNGQSKSLNSLSGSVLPLKLLVYCARGGQRSMGMATILAELHCPNCEVMCLAGGYKAWRRLLVRQLNCWPMHIAPGGMSGNLWVLSSLTGCGKTLLLEELEKSGEHVLNLERMAEHKGSMFGGSDLTKSPTQKVFESRLHAALHSCLNAPCIWTECESKSVGPSCHLNEGFWRRLRGTEGTRRIWLSASLNSRVDYILRDYADWVVCSEEKHEWVLKSLANYHSKKRLESWRGLMQRGDFAAFVAELLEHHYDPLYKKSRGPMLQHFADHGLLHRIELPTISQSYFRLEVVPRLLELSTQENQFGPTTTQNSVALFHF
ncbi:unnamed protein product, partial [Hymenolepis diminuta]